METEVKLTKLASCAGCGAKVGAGVKAEKDWQRPVSVVPGAQRFSRRLCPLRGSRTRTEITTMDSASFRGSP